MLPSFREYISNLYTDEKKRKGNKNAEIFTKTEREYVCGYQGSKGHYS